VQWYRHKYTSSHHRRAWRERCRKFVSCIYAATLQKATFGRDTFPFKNFPCCRACMGSLPPGNCLTSHLERTTEPRSGQFRPGQPTTGQTCSWKVPAVTTSTLPHNATEAQGSCPQRSGEALELWQGWLEALLPSHRWIRWEIATSGHIKHWEGIPGFLREPTICVQTMYPTWPSQEPCVMLGQRVRDSLSLLHPSPSGDWLW